MFFQSPATRPGTAQSHHVEPQKLKIRFALLLRHSVGLKLQLILPHNPLCSRWCNHQCKARYGAWKLGGNRSYHRPAAELGLGPGAPGSVS